MRPVDRPGAVIVLAVRPVLSADVEYHSFGFGGHNVTLAFGRA
jgi:hypothetical protein